MTSGYSPSVFLNLSGIHSQDSSMGMEPISITRNQRKATKSPREVMSVLNSVVHSTEMELVALNQNSKQNNENAQELVFEDDNPTNGRYCNPICPPFTSRFPKFNVPISTDITKPVAMLSPRSIQASNSVPSPRNSIVKSPRKKFRTRSVKLNRPNELNPFLRESMYNLGDMEEAILNIELSQTGQLRKAMSFNEGKRKYNLGRPDLTKKIDSLVSPRSAFQRSAPKSARH